MYRPALTLLAGFAILSLTYSYLNCSRDNLFLCGNMCAPRGKICYCGDKSFETGWSANYVCISTTSCILDFDGNVRCSNATMEIQPFYTEDQGICSINYLDYSSVPCKNNGEGYNCSKEVFRKYLCRGYFEVESCDE